MRIRVMSDLHLEFTKGRIDLEPDPEATLVLAGDIALAKKSSSFKDFLEKIAQDFKFVVYVMGNHEHYKGSFLCSENKLQDACAHLLNVFVVEKDWIVLDGVNFVGATLWTDMDNANPIAMEYIKNVMNDFRVIRTGGNNNPYARKLHPFDVHQDFVIAKSYLEGVLTNCKGRKTVVVTHHAPSFKSVSEEYKPDFPMNYGYFTELHDFIDLHQPNLWVHGHMHHSNDYKIGDTRILSNPRGYPMGRGTYENRNFDPNLTVEI